MRCLIDTCLFVNILEDAYINEDIKSILFDYENVIYVSSETLKELTRWRN